MKSRALLFFLGGAVVFLAVLALILSALIGGAKGVRRINREDPSLIAAIHKAQKGLPDFIGELQHPVPGERFAIMGTFKSPFGNEYLWLKNPTLKSGKFTGILDQNPVSAPVAKGDSVTVAQPDVVDWLIREPDGTSKGRFTENAK